MKIQRTFIIAEAGVNHNGQADLALKLTDAAASAGADAVKFQTFKAGKIATRMAGKADYQKKTTNSEEYQYQMLKKLELDEGSHIKLKKNCEDLGIIFLSSPFDLESIEFLNNINLNIFKIPSGEITNLPYLRKIGRLDKKLILSTGMSDLSEVKDAVNVLTSSGTQKDNIIVLHCNTEYPTPFKDVNLKAMLSIRDQLGVKVGYSDHTSGIEIPIAAVALGAEVIEKHFTLDRNMEGPDHRASLEPDEFKEMICAIRKIEEAMGDGIKRSSDSERNNKYIVRKSIVASRQIKAGEVFSEDNITVKRPAQGISPMRWDEIIGKKANRDFKEDQLIEL